MSGAYVSDTIAPRSAPMLWGRISVISYHVFANLKFMGIESNRLSNFITVLGVSVGRYCRTLPVSFFSLYAMQRPQAI